MRQMVLAFWLGVAVSAAVLIAGEGATTFDAEIRAGESPPLELVQRVDQGALGRVLAPAALTLGGVRVSKRGWGLLTTYAEELTVAGSRLSSQAGVPVDVRIALEMPGAVVATNAPGREGRALVWRALPDGAPLRAQTRAVHWPLVALLAAAIALSLRAGAR